MAAEYQALASGGYATAIGNGTQATAYNSTALGYKSTATNYGAMALGDSSNATNGYATAIGSAANASGNSATAIGRQAQAAGFNSIAAGTAASTDSNSAYSVAIGTSATTTVTGGVAIGSGSIANRAAGVSGYDPSTKTTSTKVDDSTWTSTAAAVSVGDADSGITRQITGVAASSEDTDAVNVAQLRAATLTAVSATATQVSTDAPNLKVTTDTSVRLPITSDTGGDLGTVPGKDYSVTLSQDLMNMHSATFSNPDVSSTTTVINTNGVTITGGTSGTVSLTSTSLNNGGNKITNVAPGTISATSSDAVNGAQLHETNVNVQKNATNIAANRTDIDNLMNKYNIGQQGLKDRINRAGATAAALAGLHPQDYDEDHKVSGSLDLGFYHGTQALTVGLFVRPTENLMFHIGGAFASNDHMLNLGVSYRFGDNSMEKKSPQQLQEEVTSLKTENTDLSARLATTNARIDSQASELKALKAQIADIQKHLH